MFVIDTRTAFAGELAVARRLHDLLLAGKQPEQALLETQEYIESLSTVGVLDRGDVLREKQAVSRRGARIRAWMGRRLLMDPGGQAIHPAQRKAGAVRDYLFRLPGAGEGAGQKAQKTLRLPGAGDYPRRSGGSPVYGQRHHDGGILMNIQTGNRRAQTHPIPVLYYCAEKSRQYCRIT